MPLTACRACGAAVSPQAHACPKCEARLAPVSPAAYGAVPPRPPAPPERRWTAVAGWLVLVAILALGGLIFFRWSTAADQRATEQAEVAREREHLVAVSSWVQNSSATGPAPESAGRPVPTSQRGKRMWVVGRMVVDHMVWRQEVMERHGFTDYELPEAMGTPQYQANARAYPQVGKYVEGRAAAVAEIQNSADAWMGAHTAALAQESGMAFVEIRHLFPPGFVRLPAGEARASNALLELHRQLVRMDPRVHYAGANQLRFEREDDMRRFHELEAEVNEALTAARRDAERKSAMETVALTRAVQ
ncbi:MAG TPA: hypothetical protein VFS20_11225 [Longimicrobium sp.]|nr:hypothetical protein [Longimicrobium sp.]